jgi:phenylalanyl-tRNA synthetase beta subunit
MRLTTTFMPPNHHKSTTNNHPENTVKTQNPLQKRYSTMPEKVIHEIPNQSSLPRGFLAK